MQFAQSEERHFDLLIKTDDPLVSSQEYFQVNPQSEFPPNFFDANQRFNVDNTKIFIKSNTAFSNDILSLYSSKEGPYTFNEMLQIINTPEWTS